MPATTAIRKRKQAYRQAVIVDVASIRYTQTSVKDTFSNGAPLSWTIYMLKTGQIKPRELPLIRIGCVNNQWRTIDNRRLYCFKTAGMSKIPAIIMQDMTAEFVYKNQSYNDGLTINLIHDPPPNIDHNQMIMAYDPETSECKRWKIITVIQQTKELKLMQCDDDDNNNNNNKNNKNTSKKQAICTDIKTDKNNTKKTNDEQQQQQQQQQQQKQSKPTKSIGNTPLILSNKSQSHPHPLSASHQRQQRQHGQHYNDYNKQQQQAIQSMTDPMLHQQYQQNPYLNYNHNNYYQQNPYLHHHHSAAHQPAISQHSHSHPPVSYKNKHQNLIQNTDHGSVRRYHSDSKLLTIKKGDVNMNNNNNNNNNNNDDNNNNNNKNDDNNNNKNDDDMKFVQYMDNDDNNATILLIDNIAKYHMKENQAKIDNTNNKKVIIDDNHIKDEIFSVLNDLQQKYPNHQQSFFEVLDQYIKQKKK